MNRTPRDQVPLNLKFLTDNVTLRDFAIRYWDARFGPGESFQYSTKVGELGASMGWNAREAIIKLRDIVEVTCGQCETCGAAHVLYSRSDIQWAVSSVGKWMCQACRDREYEERNRLYREQQELRRQQLAAMPVPTEAEVRQRYLNANYLSPRANDLTGFSLTDAVYLQAAFRASQCENLHYILPLEKTRKPAYLNPVTPGSLYTQDVLTHLFKRGIIAPSPQSDQAAFNWNSDNVAGQFYIFQVIWRIAPVDGAKCSLVEVIDQLFKDRNLPKDWVSEVNPLWKQIALNECIEYLKHQMSEHKMPFKHGEMTRRVLEDGLTTLSVAQMYNHIYGAVTGAAAYAQKKSEEISIFQAANSVIGRIESRIERARVNEWNVKPYNRNFECPRSVISQVLFDAVLGIGDDGFNKRPGLKIASTGATSV